MTITRWEQLYQEDRRVKVAPTSICGQKAVSAFTRFQKTNILDLGCGVGRDTVLFEAAGLRSVGADAAINGLSIAKTILTDTPLVCADARSLPFENESFDGVYCFGLLHEFASTRAEDDTLLVVVEIERILQPSGVCVLAVLAGDPDTGLPHVRLFTEQMFHDVIQRFEIIECQHIHDTGCTGSRDYRVWCSMMVRV